MILDTKDVYGLRMVHLVFFLPHVSETRIVWRASLHLHCLSGVLVAIVSNQGCAKILESVSTHSEDESLVASLGYLYGIQVSLSHISYINDGEHNLGKGWHDTHQQHLAIV